MIVGLNLLYLLPGVVGGTETYAAGLIHGLSQVEDDARFVVYCNHESAKWPLPGDSRFSRVVCPVRATSRVARYWFEQRSLPGLIRSDRIDVLHSLGYVAPLTLPCPSVVTVPDVHFLAHGRPADWPRRLLLRFFVRESIARAAAVIAISGFTRDVLVRTYHLSPDVVDVVLLAAKPRAESRRHDSEILAKAGIARPYLMAFGGLTPNKNIERLIQAYRLARAQYGVEQDLVIVGRLPPGLVSDSTPEVITPGYLPDDEVAALLRNAVALVFPSVYEGFGLPVLEAMAAGVSVACSRVAAIPEVAGDAALYFDPFDVEDIARQMARLCTEESTRLELAARGRARAARFTWEETARQTSAVYRRVVASSLTPRTPARVL